MKREAFAQVNSYVGIVTGDALAGLSALPADLFNVVLTSPPYFWARDYEVDGQIGHEDTVDDFVRVITDVFDQVKRVLHPEGVFFLNLGDSYYSGNGQPHGEDPRSPSRNFMRTKLRPLDQSGWALTKKSLIGVPWRVALEMQARGWTLRSDIIWNRGNAFVEPTARDRPYRQHEHIFMFVKSRFYSFDRVALPEEDVWNINIERATRIDHSASFPGELARRCIEAGSPPGGWVLDPFVGSGTVLDIAQRLGRNAVGIDLKKEYTADVAKLLRQRGNTRIPWSDLETRWEFEPAGWDSWRGNRRNFRKPGTPRQPISLAGSNS